MSAPYWRLSWVYACYFAILGVLAPYWNLYLSDLNYRPGEIGELSALLVGTKMIAPNVWGYFSDRHGNNLAMIRWACGLSVLAFAGYFVRRGFQDYWLLTLVFGFFWNAALPQFEAATLIFLGKARHRYGQVRLWGSVGFVLAVTGMGRLLDQVGSWHVLPVVFVLLLILWSGAWALPSLPKQVRHTGEPLPALLKKPEIIAFFAVYLLLQFAHGPYYVFYSIFLRELGYAKTTIGGLWSLGVVAEIILFVWIRPVLARCSLRKLLLTSLFLSALRWLLIAWGGQWLSLLLIAQLLHAASFGGAHIAAIHLVDRYFGQAHPGKGQALYNSLSFGAGGMLGSLFAGYAWMEWGPIWVYTSASAACMLALLLAFGWVGKACPEPMP